MTEIAGGREIMSPCSLEEEPQDFNEAALSWSNKSAMAVKRACYWGHALYYNPIPLERANSRPLSDAAHSCLCCTTDSFDWRDHFNLMDKIIFTRLVAKLYGIFHSDWSVVELNKVEKYFCVMAVKLYTVVHGNITMLSPFSYCISKIYFYGSFIPFFGNHK